jgi:hypothetical protein
MSLPRNELAMDRPTEDEVDLALIVTRPGAAVGANVACVLKAEVLALRADLEAAERRIVELKLDNASLEAHLAASENALDVQALKALAYTNGVRSAVVHIRNAREDADRLSATIARVRLLPAKWRKRRCVDDYAPLGGEYTHTYSDVGAAKEAVFIDCADDLEQALEGT